MKKKKKESIHQFMARRNAMQHSNALGAGAAKRRKLKSPDQKVHTVMSEFKRGTLHSGSGGIVHNPKQAIAIALSEARKKKRKKRNG